MNSIGQPISRVDGRAKVTGAAGYAAEPDMPRLAHAALVTSTIASGRVSTIDTAAAERAAGVLAVITHENAPRVPYRPRAQRPPVDPETGNQLEVFQSPLVLFNGQPIAVVVADTLEHARHAATLVRVSYETTAATTEFDEEHSHPPSEAAAEAGQPGASSRGDADAAFRAAPVTIDHRYTQPREQHHAMEPHATIAAWHDGRLTLYDKTQWVGNVRAEIAHVFGIAEERVRVISPYVGGAFGSALRTWPHVTIAALAAREVGRPVRLELTRRQLVTSVGFRPHTSQRVALAADREGRLSAIIHEAAAQTSVYEDYAERTLDPARTMYSCANVRTRYRLVPMHTNTPCPMRAPGIATGICALEMAMDELAEALGMDPVELRLRNHAERNQHEELPWSSKELRECYRVAADRFGWARRRPEPRSMRVGRWLVGYGMATAMYPGEQSPASASVTIFANGTALVRTASSDMGPGTYTSMTQIAADTLGLPIDKVGFELGDTDMPTAPVHGGSITMASVGNAVRIACEAARAEALTLVQEPVGVTRVGAVHDEDGAPPDYTALLAHKSLGRIDVTAESKPDEEAEKFSTAAFGAVFAEVAVDPDLGTVRVRRLVGAYDVGRVINPKIARSQCIGGMVGGIGMALHEQAEWDGRFGRVMNANLAEYLVPVNADVPALETVFVPSDDRHFNALGVKGLAEIALCGVAPAIANAVYHATGRRIRELPIMPERLLT